MEDRIHERGLIDNFGSWFAKMPDHLTARQHVEEASRRDFALRHLPKRNRWFRIISTIIRRSAEILRAMRDDAGYLAINMPRCHQLTNRLPNCDAVIDGYGLGVPRRFTPHPKWMSDLVSTVAYSPGQFLTLWRSTRPRCGAAGPLLTAQSG